MTERLQGLSIELDLETMKVNSGLTDLKSRMKLVNSEMKANLSAFDRGDKSIKGYETRLQGLNKKLELQREITDKAQKSYEKMVKEHGEGSKEAEKAAREYNNQVAVLNSLERSVDRTKKELKQLREEQRIAESGWTKFGNKLDATGKKLTNVGNGLKNVGKNMSMYITAPLAGMAFAANRSFYDVEEGLDNVTKATGATGEQLDNLHKSFKNVYGDFPTDSAVLGNVLGEVNTRFAFTDKQLEDSTKKFLEFSKITGVDATNGVQLVARAMGDAGIEAEEYERVLDSVAKAAQATGIGADKLLDSITKYGAPMRALGFDMDESIALFSSWELAGVNAEIAMSGLKQSISRWGKEGKDPREEFQKTLKEIEKAPDIAAATSLAIEAFGAKAGPDLADAIQGGRFEFEELLKTLESSEGTVGQTFDNTVKGADKFKVAMNNMKLVGQDVWSVFEDVAGPILDKLVSKLQQGVKWFSGLSEQTKLTGLIFAGLAFVLGPIIAFGGMFIAMIGSIMTAMAPVMASIAKAGGLLKWLRLGLVAFTGPVGLTIGAITLLGAGFIGLYKNSETFREAIGQLIERVKQLLKDALNAIQPAIQAIIQFFKDQLAVLQQFWEENSQVIIQALLNIGKFVKSVMNGVILPVIQFVMPFILMLIKSVWSNIQGVISGALNIIMGAVKIFSGLLTGDFSKMWEGVKQLFKGGIEFAWNLFNLMFIGRIVKGVAGFVSSFGTALRNGWTNSINGIKNFVQNAKNSFKSFVDDGLKRFNDLVAGAKALPGKIGQGIKSMAGKVTDGVKSVANNMTSTLGKGVNGVVGGVNWVLGKVGVKNLIPLWSIPQYADGTEGHPGGLAVVGDGTGSNAGPELIQTPDGKQYLSPSKDTLVNLPKGTQVLSATLTKQLLNIPRYANGTGWLSSAWEKTKQVGRSIKDKAFNVWNFLSNPTKLLNQVLSSLGVEVPSLPGILKNIGTGAFSKVKNSMFSFLSRALKGVKPPEEFATGGKILKDGLYRLAEGGWPEFVIPTDPNRRTDAMKLLALAGKEIGGNKRPNQLPSVGDSHSEGENNELLQLLQATLEQNGQLQQVVELLTKILEKNPDVYLGREKLGSIMDQEQSTRVEFNGRRVAY